jgi:hypothetical protein
LEKGDASYLLAPVDEGAAPDRSTRNSGMIARKIVTPDAIACRFGNGAAPPVPPHERH